jgi:alkylation response protein AidB-like acyl-CoA dehydrogenase
MKGEGGMQFTLTKEQALIQKMARDYAEQNIAPIAEQIEKDNQVPAEILKGLAELDLFGMAMPEAYVEQMPVMTAMCWPWNK